MRALHLVFPTRGGFLGNLPHFFRLGLAYWVVCVFLERWVQARVERERVEQAAQNWDRVIRRRKREARAAIDRQEQEE